VGIAPIVLLCAKLSRLKDAVSVIAMIVGIAVASVAGNSLGTRLLGPDGATMTTRADMTEDEVQRAISLACQMQRWRDLSALGSAEG